MHVHPKHNTHNIYVANNNSNKGVYITSMSYIIIILHKSI